MTTQTKKYVVSSSRVRSGVKNAPRRTFFELAKKNIVKGKRGGERDLSQRIDEVAYGI